MFWYLNPVPFISVDNEKAAYGSAKFIADGALPGTQAAILEGIPYIGEFDN